MQMKNTVGDPSVAKVLFAHVDPATGKFTAWTFALSESALSVPRPLQTPGGSENMVPPESMPTRHPRRFLFLFYSRSITRTAPMLGWAGSA